MGSRREGTIEFFVEQQGAMILDGGLATALEARGRDLDDPLWSARLLLEDPEQIRQVHRDYLTAGADCIISSSYQASLAGFLARGVDRARAAELVDFSVSLAVDVRDEFWDLPENRIGRLRPLVAASVGPYGAAEADGSEYTGDYGVDEQTLYAFHEARWRILTESSADLLACETIPSSREACVLLELLRETKNAVAWISFSCRDDRHLNDGSSLAEVMKSCDSEAGVAALGINCTSPEHLPSLLECARAATSKPLIVYPNSGEIYDARTRSWRSSPSPVDWPNAARHWKGLGASGIGGCCRVGPAEISAIRRGLLG